MRFAVLGSPINHSLSPQLHNFAYKELGVEAHYERFQVERGQLGDFFESHSSESWDGFSLTMPLKDEALNFTTELDSDSVHASSINTLKRVENGWAGFNTDVYGFRFLIEKFLRDSRSESWKFGAGSSVSIIGAGGTARAALVALRDYDVSVKVYRRNGSRDESIRRANPRVEILEWSEWMNSFDASLIINCAPKDAFKSMPFGISISGFLLDALYDPWPTPLMKLTARDSQFSGKDLLVAQAIRQIEIFLELQLNRDDFFEKLRAII